MYPALICVSWCGMVAAGIRGTQDGAVGGEVGGGLLSHQLRGIEGGGRSTGGKTKARQCKWSFSS